jgi:hypothetical protein
MKISNLSRYKIVVCAAIVIPAGCGGSQPPMSASTGTLPNAATTTSGEARCTLISGLRRCALVIQTAEGRPSTYVHNWTPADVQAAYGLPSFTKGTGQTVALVIPYDNPNVVSDLAVYRSRYNLGTANFYKYNEYGQQGNYPKTNPTEGVGIDADVEMVAATCPNCTIDLIESNSTGGSDLQTAEAEAVKLGANIVANGWACAHGTECVDHAYFSAKGVLYLGAGNDVYQSYRTFYPADFKNFVAVGATVLAKAGGKRGYSESVWPRSYGGCETAPKPRWQNDSVCTSRLADDASMVGATLSFYDSYGSYGWLGISGTDIAESLLAGAFALAANEAQQDGGKTFWIKAHLKHLYNVCGGSCLFGQYSYGGGMGSPHGIGAL